MAQQTIALGASANDGTGTKARAAGSMLNDMFTELYAFYTKTPINAQTGTSYTPVIGDAGKLITCSNAGAIAVTWPAHADVAYDAEVSIKVAALGAGAVTITGDAGVTINGVSGGSVVLDGQYAGAELIQLSTDVWLAIGKLV
ncbi:hypothetical protein C8D77_11169 [Mesorhizobium loti]|uniref:Uncharacterized protein n=1 Tax=Rhizobium loti TaxID=381 RepID=A0A8E3B3D4_RHILI|nr:hypothetical protein [Mesorhizobium loti]PWJ88347.1 hypothetical protein C8D77_11169 [Mesorhizobium loti]